MPYLSFRNFLITLCLPVVILKAIQYHIHKAFKTFSKIYFDTFGLISKFTCISLVMVIYFFIFFITWLNDLSDYLGQIIFPTRNQETHSSVQTISPSSNRSSINSSQLITPHPNMHGTPIDLGEVNRLLMNQRSRIRADSNALSQFEHLKEPQPEPEGYLPLRMQLRNPLPAGPASQIIHPNRSTQNAMITQNIQPRSNPGINNFPPPVVTTQHYQQAQQIERDNNVERLLEEARVMNEEHWNWINITATESYAYRGRTDGRKVKRTKKVSRGTTLDTVIE